MWYKVNNNRTHAHTISVFMVGRSIHYKNDEQKLVISGATDKVLDFEQNLLSGDYRWMKLPLHQHTCTLPSDLLPIQRDEIERMIKGFSEMQCVSNCSSNCSSSVNDLQDLQDSVTLKYSFVRSVPKVNIISFHEQEFNKELFEQVEQQILKIGPTHIGR